MDRFLVSLLLLCVSTPARLGDSARREEPASLALHEPDICDDAEHLVEEELGGEENWKCPRDEYFVITNFLGPGGHSECSNTTVEPDSKCMSEELHYDMQPPSSGLYRPLPPKYGDYRYLPPQRWLHALNYGGVAFLYHPCAPQEQVIALKHLARSCLWKSVITPYPHLTKDQPLALVAWGCVYRMAWLKTSEAKLWIRQHALKTESSSITTNGIYDRGLLEDAKVVSTEVVCLGETDKDRPAGKPETPGKPESTAAVPPGQEAAPSPQETPEDPTTQDTASSSSPPASPSPQTENSPSTSPSPKTESAPPTSPSPQTESTKLCRNRTEGDSDSIICSPTVVAVLVSNHSGYIALILVASLALVLVIAVFLWKGGVCRSGARKKARYKSVSKFFPFSYGQGEGSQVAMPELGLPKTMPAEREMLLNESDEDEL